MLNEDKISQIKDILDSELPQLRYNSYLRDFILYSILDKMYTVQKAENVLSYEMATV